MQSWKSQRCICSSVQFPFPFQCRMAMLRTQKENGFACNKSSIAFAKFIGKWNWNAAANNLALKKQENQRKPERMKWEREWERGWKGNEWRVSYHYYFAGAHIDSYRIIGVVWNFAFSLSVSEGVSPSPLFRSANRNAIWNVSLLRVIFGAFAHTHRKHRLVIIWNYCFRRTQSAHIFGGIERCDICAINKSKKPFIVMFVCVCAKRIKSSCNKFFYNQDTSNACISLWMSRDAEYFVATFGNWVVYAYRKWQPFLWRYLLTTRATTDVGYVCKRERERERGRIELVAMRQNFRIEIERKENASMFKLCLILH